MGRDKDPNRELMLARGSKTGAYDADAPDQWKFDLRHGLGEVKALAWVKSKTIAFGHQTPYCTDEQGNALYIDHMAVDLGWEVQSARNVLTRLAAEGRLRLENKRIWYNADVPKAYEELDSEEGRGEQAHTENKGPDSEQRRNKSEQSNSVQSYVTHFIAKLPAEKQAAAKVKIKACMEWRREFIADGMAALRSIADRVEDTTLLEIGVPKKRLQKRRPEKCKWVQLSLLAEPNFVQSYEPEPEANSVQSSEPGSYKVQNGLYKSQNGGASLLYSSTATASTTTEASPPSDDALVVVAKLQDYGATIGKPGAQKLLAQCRTEEPECTVEDVTAAIEYIGRTISKSVKNRTGLFVSQVPPLLASQKAASLRKPKPETKEEQQRREAEQVLREPAGFDAETREWAEKFLGVQARGAGR